MLTHALILLSLIASLIAALLAWRALRAANRLGEDRLTEADRKLEKIERDLREKEFSAAEASAARRQVLQALGQGDRRPLLAAFKGWIAGNPRLVAGAIAAIAALSISALIFPLSGGNTTAAPKINSKSADPSLRALASYAKGLPIAPYSRPPMSMRPTSAKSVPDVETMIERLKSRLEGQPRDAKGWRMLAWSYANTGRPREAASAYARALALNDRVASWHAAYGEALIRASGGRITPAARAALDRAMKIEPSNQLARFYKGLDAEQSGKKKAALQIWLTLAKERPKANGAFANLRARISALAKELGEKLPADLSAAKKPSMTASRGPTAEDIRRARSMSAEDRAAMIKGMVDGLADRLKSSPRDEAGWIKLIRSRMVLKEPGKAREALREALEIFAGDPVASARIASSAKALGVSAN